MLLSRGADPALPVDGRNLRPNRFGQPDVCPIDRRPGRLPGRLSYVTVPGCAGFVTMSGSSMGSSTLMVSLMLSEMNRCGYKRSMSLGPIRFAQITLLAPKISFNTPHFGLPLVVKKGVASSETTLRDLHMAAFSFILCSVVSVALLLLFPVLALWLPGRCAGQDESAPGQMGPDREYLHGRHARASLMPNA